MRLRTKAPCGWTIYEPQPCLCVDGRVGYNRNQPVLILDFLTVDEERKVVGFFNVTETAKGGYTVGDKSKFAKLYRLTIGDNPKRLKGKAHQLIKHFIGECLVVSFKEAQTDKGVFHFKAEEIKPIEPIITHEWFSTGELKGKVRGRYRDKVLHRQQKSRNNLDESWISIGNKLEIKKTEKVPNDLGSCEISNTSKHKTLGVSTLIDTKLEVINDKEKVFTYYQGEDESLDDYYQRVIDESF